MAHRQVTAETTGANVFVDCPAGIAEPGGQGLAQRSIVFIIAAEAERTRALRLVVGVLGRDRVERALANGGIGSLLRDGRTAYRPTGSMGPPSDAGRRSRSDEMYHVTSW